MLQKIIPVGLSAVIAILWAGCGLPDPLAVPQANGNMWPERFRIVSLNQAAAASAAFARHFPATRQGQQKDAMRLIAPVSIRAEFGQPTEAALLKTTAAAVFNMGDGFQMDVWIGAPGREEEIVYSRTFRAGIRAADRAWIPLEIPLDLQGLDRGYLEIRLSGGPRGDLTADWLALADFEVLSASKPR